MCESSKKPGRSSFAELHANGDIQRQILACRDGLSYKLVTIPALDTELDTGRRADDGDAYRKLKLFHRWAGIWRLSRQRHRLHDIYTRVGVKGPRPRFMISAMCSSPSLTRSCMLFALVLTACQAGALQTENRRDTAAACAPTGIVYTRTTLYFGLARPAGTISEKQWKAFVREEVTARFPQGFTVWEAQGQWQAANGQISRERSKVLLLVHPDTTTVRDSITSLITSYKQRFQQESVLWETALVCAAF